MKVEAGEHFDTIPPGWFPELREEGYSPIVQVHEFREVDDKQRGPHPPS